jgi:hypothetical protein
MGAIISHRRSPQLPPPPPPPPPSDSSLASLPENVLAEIFLKLPSQPAHLRNVALGSHQFRDVVTNRPFLRRFLAHHDDVPPLVGFFVDEKMQIPRFLPTGSKSAGSGGALELWDDGWAIVSTRHGRLLLRSPDRQRLLVLDPFSGRRKYIDAPTRCLTLHRSTAELVCDPSAGGHAHCRSGAFRVVFVYFSHLYRTVMYIYSSETEQWVKVGFQDVTPISAIDVRRPCIHVGDVIYWPIVFAWFLAFNVNTHQLRKIPIPLEFSAERFNAGFYYTVVAPKDGRSLGFVHVDNEHNNLQLWVSNFFNGAHVEWIPLRTVSLDSILPLGCVREPEEFRIVGYDEHGNCILLPLGGATTRKPEVKIVGYDEDENVLYLWTQLSFSENSVVFGLQLDTMQSNKLLENSGWMHKVYPYKSYFITAGSVVSQWFLFLALVVSFLIFYVL